MVENEVNLQSAIKLEVDYLQGNYLAPLEKVYES